MTIIISATVMCWYVLDEVMTHDAIVTTSVLEEEVHHYSNHFVPIPL